MYEPSTSAKISSWPQGLSTCSERCTAVSRDGCLTSVLTCWSLGEGCSRCGAEGDSRHPADRHTGNIMPREEATCRRRKTSEQPAAHRQEPQSAEDHARAPAQGLAPSLLDQAGPA